MTLMDRMELPSILSPSLFSQKYLPFRSSLMFAAVYSSHLLFSQRRKMKLDMLQLQLRRLLGQEHEGLVTCWGRRELRSMPQLIRRLQQRDSRGKVNESSDVVSCRMLIARILASRENVSRRLQGVVREYEGEEARQKQCRCGSEIGGGG